MAGHALGGGVGGIEDLEVVVAALGEGSHLVAESLDLVEVGRLAEANLAGGLRVDQPGRELLDAGPVLGPELDVFAVLVALALGAGQQVGYVLGDAVQFVLEVLGVLWNLVALKNIKRYEENKNTPRYRSFCGGGRKTDGIWEIVIYRDLYD